MDLGIEQHIRTKIFQHEQFYKKKCTCFEGVKKVRTTFFADTCDIRPILLLVILFWERVDFNSLNLMIQNIHLPVRLGLAA